MNKIFKYMVNSIYRNTYARANFIINITKKKNERKVKAVD